MDAAPQQATAVIREGDPSQSRPNNAEVKVDVADAAKKSESPSKSKDATKGADKKKKNMGKKKKQSGTNGLKKDKRKKKKPVASTTSSSSESTDDSTEDSDSNSEQDDTNPIFRKRSVKKPQDTRKTKLPNKAKRVPYGKTTPEADSDSSDSDSETGEEEEEVDGEEEEDKPAPTPRKSKKNKGETPDPALSNAVARELQRLLQQVQIQQPTPLQPQIGGLGAGLGGVTLGGGGYDGGLNSGFSGLNFVPPTGRPLWIPPAGQAPVRLNRAPTGKAAGLDDAQDDTGDPPADPARSRAPSARGNKNTARGSAAKNTAPKKLDFKRVDQVWDNLIHNFKLQDTAKFARETKYDGFCFHVRRTFDWEGKYKSTVIDIKSKVLRECLQDVIGNIKGVSLVDETPKLDPNVLFLYLEDLRQHVKVLKKQIASPSGSDKQARRKESKRLEEKRQSLKILVKYIDKDYDHIKNSLYPMLEHGLITFDLLWALWKPNTLAFTTTYGSQDEPRIFKVDTAEKHHHLSKGEFYYVDGKYFEYDGKQFGYGHMVDEIPEFKGAKKITSLSCYPLKYHKSEAKLRLDLIERGKKFVTLAGVHYKSHQGMAYYKKKRAIVKVNVNGRVMVDSAIHRRINPNYPISIVRPKDDDLLSDDEDSDDEDDCGCGGSDDDVLDRERELEDGEEEVKYVTKLVKDDKGRIQVLRMTKDEAEDYDKEKTHKVESREDEALEGSDREDKSKGDGGKKVPEFTDEEYLIASPVVLGFSFGEKLWLEFTVSGIKDISWNENAYESLVLEPKTKETVKALVESHKYHAAESIDDVIQGKGKGLVAVLHGPPGTGKTLTAEGISELLKCPLYMVSAGELGTDSRVLEGELQRILDICHAWGAILLLDEADVFLEKRNMHDIHRNALVSIFLRQLEYFQGILFLTTNRVETFDDAFQSRIHIALRYDPLDRNAKKAIFKMFVERARAQQQKKKTTADEDNNNNDSNNKVGTGTGTGTDTAPAFTDDDYDSLARNDLNGRQIKNTVIRAQALAVNKGEPLAMAHVRQILDVQVNFDRDLKGGTGYQDAMRSYF